MCLKPVTIDNINYKHPLAHTEYGLLHNCTTSKIQVPCGHCSTCIALRQAYLVQRMQMESLHNFLYMGMLSYNNASLPTLNVNGFNIRYADGADFSNMIRHIRLNQEIPDFRYFAVSEFGGRSHRPHWHFIISIPHRHFTDKFGRVHLSDAISLQEKLWSIFLKYWRRNYGSRKFPDWRPLLTYKRVGTKRNYDLSFIDTISGNCEDAAFYATKYATKYDEYTDRLKSALYFNLPDDKCLDTWKIVRPRSLWSKGFGDPFHPDVYYHIMKGIDYSIQSGSILPLFINPNTGQTFPLSPYYQKKLMNKEQCIHFKVLQSQNEKDLLSIYETTLKDFMLEKTKERIRYRSDDSTQFLDSEIDLNSNIINDFAQNGNIEENFVLDDWSFDGW